VVCLKGISSIVETVSSKEKDLSTPRVSFKEWSKIVVIPSDFPIFRGRGLEKHAGGENRRRGRKGQGRGGGRGRGRRG